MGRGESPFELIALFKKRWLRYIALKVVKLRQLLVRMSKQCTWDILQSDLLLKLSL